MTGTRPRNRGSNVPREASDAALGLRLNVPLAVVAGVFLLGPTIFGLTMAFQRINSRTLNDRWDFNGVANWSAVFRNEQFYAALPRTVVLATGTVLIAVSAALGIALVLHRRFTGRALVQVSVLMPWVVAPVAAGLMWRWIFDGNFGFVNFAGSRLGLIEDYVPWLSKPAVAMTAAVLAESWRGIPLLALLFLARLSTINPVVYSAATVDGAGPFQRFLRVTLPSMRAIIGVAIVIQTINALQAFDVLFTLTQGGPSGATTVLNLLVYRQAFQNLNFGQAAVLAILAAVLTAVAIGLAATIAWVVSTWRTRRTS